MDTTNFLPSKDEAIESGGNLGLMLIALLGGLFGYNKIKSKSWWKPIMLVPVLAVGFILNASAEVPVLVKNIGAGIVASSAIAGIHYVATTPNKDGKLLLGDKLSESAKNATTLGNSTHRYIPSNDEVPSEFFEQYSPSVNTVSNTALLGGGDYSKTNNDVVVL